MDIIFMEHFHLFYLSEFINLYSSILFSLDGVPALEKIRGWDGEWVHQFAASLPWLTWLIFYPCGISFTLFQFVSGTQSSKRLSSIVLCRIRLQKKSQDKSNVTKSRMREPHMYSKTHCGRSWTKPFFPYEYCMWHIHHHTQLSSDKRSTKVWLAADVSRCDLKNHKAKQCGRIAVLGKTVVAAQQKYLNLSLSFFGLLWITNLFAFLNTNT